MTTERAILAGGCFWGMEDLLRKLNGVLDTTVGYTGGHILNPTYEHHDGHAEAIEVVFNPEIISYHRVLECFFQIHDPTTFNRQGNDVGTSYRSAIFYIDDAQKRTAEQLIVAMDASGRWPQKIVTEITPASEFYAAEGYHQDYLERYPNGYTCHYPRPHWIIPNENQTIRKTS
jgi:peptide-methionine (S)-S-oxide reductase